MEYKDFFVVADFDLSVDGLTPPKVVGQVRPQRIEDREPFSESEARPVYDPTLWDWDIAIDMPSGGYFIKNDQLDAELSANLKLQRERGQPSYLGAAEFIRGRVYLFDKAGRVTRGILIFDDPIKNDPQLDLDVVFRIQQPRVQTRTETSSSPVVDLNLHISGRASEPLIQPEAPYSEQDVLLLLAANMTLSTGSDSLAVSDPLANRLRFAATGLVFSEVQRAAARRLGLETLEINSGDNPFDASITVGRYVIPQLYLYGTTPLDAGAGQEVGFEYRISRRIFLDGNRDKNNLYRMNIHFNWEY
jgi:autotransporter translocation and assembly factor TamB